MVMMNSNLNLLVKLFIGPDSDNDWRTEICIIYVLRSTSQSQSNNCPLNWKYFPTIIRKHQMRSSGSSGSRSSPGPPERQALHASQHQLSTFSPREKGFFILINNFIINIVDIMIETVSWFLNAAKSWQSWWWFWSKSVLVTANSKLGGKISLGQIVTTPHI